MSSTTIWNVGWASFQSVRVQQRNRGGGREYLLAMERLQLPVRVSRRCCHGPEEFCRVTRGWCKRHIQYARFKCQHRTARNITITQFEHFIQYCANLALNQFNFQFNRRARREFLLVDHVEHLAGGFQPLNVGSGSRDTPGFVRAFGDDFGGTRHPRRLRPRR